MQVDKSNAALETHFFDNLVLATDNYFIHRARGTEKRDGSPLKEKRMLCNSMMNNNNRMCADKTIKFDMVKSGLKYRVGD